MAALQIVLVFTGGNDLQLTSAVETGITPANLMHSMSISHVLPPEPQLPSIGEDSSFSYVGLGEENSRVASNILLDSHQWNRLRPVYRDFLLGFSKAAEKKNPHDPVLKTVLLRISTFYPDDPDLLLLKSAMFYTHKQPIVTIFLAKNLLEQQLKHNDRTAEALNNMAAGYTSLVSRICFASRRNSY